MLIVNNIYVGNIEGAIHGMRFPMESNSMSDTIGDNIGERDIELASKLSYAGTDHGKFMRQIFVSMDITAPLYWWKEADTYKVATVANSESTMHKLASTPITRELFSLDGATDDDISRERQRYPGDASRNFDEDFDIVLTICEDLRRKYMLTKDIRYWRALIQILPSSWNQKRHWTGNYAVLKNMYHARKFHKLTEWHQLCKVIEQLPYAKELIMRG